MLQTLTEFDGCNECCLNLAIWGNLFNFAP